MAGWRRRSLEVASARRVVPLVAKNVTVDGSAPVERGPLITLRPWVASDATALATLFDDPEELLQIPASHTFRVLAVGPTRGTRCRVAEREITTHLAGDAYGRHVATRSVWPPDSVDAPLLTRSGARCAASAFRWPGGAPACVSEG